MRIRHLINFCFLSIVPLIFLALALIFRHSPASILMKKDPVYYYLMNSYLLALGEGAHYVAHPGAPLQVLGGFLVWLKSIFFGESNLPKVAEFLSHHSEYVSFLGLAVIFCNFLFLSWATLLLYLNGVAPVMIGVTQIIVCFIPMTISFWGLFQPESLHVTMASFLLVCLIAAKRERLAPLYIGTAIALKLNYGPHLLLSFLFKKSKAIGLTLAKSLAVATIFCLVLWKEWGQMLSLQFKAFIASGRYDQGGVGFLNLSWIQEQLLSANFSFEYAYLGLAIGLGFIGYFLKEKNDLRRDFFVCLIIFLFCILAYLKKPTHEYYLAPAWAIFPALLVAFSRMLSGWKLGLLVFLIIPCFYFQFSRLDFVLGEHTRRISIANDEFVRLKRILESQNDCTQLILGPVPHEIESLQVGAEWAGRKWTDILKARHNDIFFLNPAHQIRDWNHKTYPEEDWLRLQTKNCVLSFLDKGQSAEAQRKINFLKQSGPLGCGELFCAFRFDLSSKIKEAPTRKGAS